jgi:hypothetical protein
MALAERQPSLDQGQTTCASDGWSWKRQKSRGRWPGERFSLRQTPWSEVVVTCDWVMKTGKCPNRRETSAVTVNLLCCAFPCLSRLTGVVYLFGLQTLNTYIFLFPHKGGPPIFARLVRHKRLVPSCQRTAPNPTNGGSAIMSCPPNDLRVTRRSDWKLFLSRQPPVDGVFCKTWSYELSK